jgi:hypothetical protein
VGAVVLYGNLLDLRLEGTNKRAGGGWGWFRVQKQVVEGEIHKCRVRAESYYLAGLAWYEVTL